MQPRDSVHHETIRLVSLNFRLRKRIAAVLCTPQVSTSKRSPCNCARGGLTIHDVQSALLHVKRGFFDRFTQRWMGVTGAPEIFGAAAELDHRNGFGD